LSAKAALAVLFGVVTIFAWYLSTRVARRPGVNIARSRSLVYAFAGIVTASELVLVASLIFGRNS
jgi:hypothetical protein